jgi:hypothetical protein
MARPGRNESGESMTLTPPTPSLSLLSFHNLEPLELPQPRALAGSSRFRALPPRAPEGLS